MLKLCNVVPSNIDFLLLLSHSWLKPLHNGVHCMPQEIHIYFLKLLPRVRTSRSNSPFPSIINNFFSPLLSPTPLTLITMIVMVANLQLWIELLNFLMESMWNNMGINIGWNAKNYDIMIVNSILMTTCMSPFSKPLLEFDSILKFSTFTNMPFCKCCSCISI